MSSRWLATALGVLPALFRSGRENPVRLDRIPADHLTKSQFDYPLFQEAPAVATRRAATMLFLVATVTPILAWWSEYLTLPYIHGGLRMLVMLIGTGLAVLGGLGNRWPLFAVGGAIVAIGLQAILNGAMPNGLAMLLPFFLALLLLGDRLVVFYLQLRTSCPVPLDKSRQIRALLKRRFRNFRRPLRGTEFYLLGFVPAVATAYYFFRHVAHQHSARGLLAASLISLAVIVGSVLWTVLLEFFAAALYRRRRFGLRALFGGMRRAIVEWTAYNRHGTDAVGIHRSPAGSCFMRRNLLLGTLLLASCAWVALLPVVDPRAVQTLNHFLEFKNQIVESAVLYELFSGEPYRFDPRPESIYDEDGNLKVNPNVAEKPAVAPEPTWSDEEQELLSRLSPERAAAFRQQREAADKLELELRANAAREQEADRAASRVIARFVLILGAAATKLLMPALATLCLALGLIFPTCARAAAGIDSLRGEKPRERVYSCPNWESLIARLRASSDPLEKESLLMGTLAADDTPVLIPRNAFREHAHILGDSGAGKTSIGLVPLITQLMRFGDASVIVIDLKADDQSVFENLRLEATRLSAKPPTNGDPTPEYRFRWFTNVRERSTFAFNPFQQKQMRRLSLDQKTDFLTASLGLQYGTDYGRKYYADSNYDVLNVALQQSPQLQSFVELDQILLNANRFPLQKETKRAAAHIGSAIRRLARVPALNVTHDRDLGPEVCANAIDFADFFATPQAAYFALPPVAGVSTTAEIARLVLYSLLTAAQSHQGKRRQVYLVIDEFQRIVANNLALFLQTARSMEIGVILANQSLADLETVDATLISATRTNCRFRQVFGVGEPSDIEDLQVTSGDMGTSLKSFAYSPTLFGGLNLERVGFAEANVPRLSRNDILLATDLPGRSIACLRRGEGYAQFGGMQFVMDSVHHISPEEYDDRKHVPWPEGVVGTFVAPMEIASVIPTPVGAGTVIESIAEAASDDGPSEDSTAEEVEEENDLEIYGLLEPLPEHASRRSKKKPARRPWNGPDDFPNLGDLLA